MAQLSVELDAGGAQADAFEQHRRGAAALLLLHRRADLDLGAERGEPLQAVAERGDDLGIGPGVGLRRWRRRFGSVGLGIGRWHGRAGCRRVGGHLAEAAAIGLAR
jgi:hypothetical protein